MVANGTERVGPSASRILRAAEEALPRGEMPIAIFNDPELHRLELERVFARNWAFVGHVSEIPARGDYVVRHIGEDPFIFIRDEQGQMRVLWNSCRHKGTQICRVDRGNASHFRCPYHGWTYKNTGQLVGIPAFKEAYEGLDRSEFSLHAAPRVEEVYGFVFANLDPGAPSLRDSLGGSTWYLDFFHGLGAMEVIGDPHRWVVDANWKIAAENFAGDEHHLLFLHRSGWKIGALQVSMEELSSGYHVHLGNGHTIDFCVLPNAKELGTEYFGYPDHIVRGFRTDHLSTEQIELARTSVIQLGLIYPNFAHLHLPLTPDAAHIPPIPVKTIRVFQPKGPDRMEILSWCLVWKDMPDDFKELSHRVLMATFSPAGIFEQDDVIPWNSITRAAGSTFARLNSPMLSYRQGFNGIGRSKQVTDWVGPGECYSPRFEEGNQRDFYARWLRDMTTSGASH
jgi:phenylpropionate dioxygenase-like ring-hydroxylating dioxygenase large terminal subunit